MEALHWSIQFVALVLRRGMKRPGLAILCSAVPSMPAQIAARGNLKYVWLKRKHTDSRSAARKRHEIS